ncbi:porin family protein [Runella sp.]|uniref:porin family protein n=1 Tax=Runella sp. TaxID=1960881 RepID=UPI00301844DB
MLIGSVNTAYSQKIRYGITGGIHAATTRRDDNGFLKNKYIFGFRTSALIDYQLLENISITSFPGISKKGYKSPNIVFNTGDFYYGIYYLELPIYATYSYKISTGKLFAGFGPYFGLGVSGKWGLSKMQKIEFGNTSTDKFKRGDVGLGFMAGYELPKGIQLMLTASLGLRKIHSNPNVVPMQNRVIGLSAVYLLKK